VVPHPVPF
jgi:hypothetical protein